MGVRAASKLVFEAKLTWNDSNFVQALLSLHAESRSSRRPRIHFHVYESIIHPGEKPMLDTEMDKNEDADTIREEGRQLSIREALALLENKEYTPVPVTWAQKMDKVNSWLSSDRSIFALKSAAAASVFATLSKASTVSLLQI